MTSTAQFEALVEGIDICAPGPMEAELVALWRRVDDLGSLPDAATASGQRALEAARDIARVRAAADALLAPYAARLDELSSPESGSRFARWKGYPNAASLLSAFTGLSVTEANKLIGLGKALTEAAARAVPTDPSFSDPLSIAMPDAAAGDPVDAPHAGDPLADLASVAPPGPIDDLAFADPPQTATPYTPAPPASPLAHAIRTGSLGTEKVTIIRRTLEDMLIDTREVEAFLVAKAGELSISELRRLCLVTLAERDPEGHAAREARQRKARYVNFYDEPDGMVAFSGKLDAPSGAWLKAQIESRMQAEVAKQRDLLPEERRDLGQIRADILVEIARHAAGCERATTRPKSTIIIRASESDVRSRTGFATIDGIEAPITIDTAHQLAVDAEFRALLTTDCGEVLNLGRAIRSATEAQRLAVMERDKGCAMCSAALSRCDAHHITPWSLGGPTDIDNLIMLCVGCHHRIHDHGWDIVIENNQVWFRPPPHLDPHRRRQPGSSARLA